MLSGLPGVGKTTLAREVGARVGGVHLRIDTIEAAMVQSGIVAAAGGWDAFPDAGYRVAYAIAADLLRAGHVVIADCVNPLAITRKAWAELAVRASAPCINVEVVCGDESVHRRRVEERRSDLDGLVVPTWEQVQNRDYEPWDLPVLRVDTGTGAVDEMASASRTWSAHGPEEWNRGVSLVRAVIHSTMPTTRPRYQVTETPEIGRLLDRAAARWPGEPRSKLLLRIIAAGGDMLDQEMLADDSAHRLAVTASSGRYPEAFGPDYLEELRADWPT